MTIGYGEFIRAHRIKSGFKSQRKLAELTNIANSTISRIEKEIHKPDVDTLRELAKHLTSTSLVELMVVCGYWDEEELLESLPLTINENENEKNKNYLINTFSNISSYKNIDKIIKNPPYTHNNEEEFIKDIELTNKALLNKYDIKIDGESISEEEANMFIASIRALRSMKKS